MATSLRITLLSGEEATVSIEPSTALLDVRKLAEEKLGKQIKSLVDKDSQTLDDKQTIMEAGLKDGDTLSAVVANTVEEIKKSFNPEQLIVTGSSRHGDWVLIHACENQSRKEEDYHNCYLFHLPSWKPGAAPVKKTSWTDNGCMGVRDDGTKLQFGPEDTLVEKDAGFGKVWETFELKSLLP
mmetsp:Transcript_128473/g.181183  ORF Transcript_128473/g.181183 Transcript_128473/m.181183 type:complete len:183 (+) Transcript_128473:31-579(+)